MSYKTKYNINKPTSKKYYIIGGFPEKQKGPSENYPGGKVKETKLETEDFIRKHLEKYGFIDISKLNKEPDNYYIIKFEKETDVFHPLQMTVNFFAFLNLFVLVPVWGGFRWVMKVSEVRNGRKIDNLTYTNEIHSVGAFIGIIPLLGRLFYGGRIGFGPGTEAIEGDEISEYFLNELIHEVTLKEGEKK
ncbi:MAG: hypothetical protein KDK90_24445 [Leptospiraceae bacterium]|nr:hypothetical protein [Leptospiraceae bacterium]